jgi:hypothetical protein
MEHLKNWTVVLSKNGTRTEKTESNIYLASTGSLNELKKLIDVSYTDFMQWAHGERTTNK